MNKHNAIYFIKTYPGYFFLTLIVGFLGGVISYYSLKSKHHEFKKQEYLDAGKFFGRLGFYWTIALIIIQVTFRVAVVVLYT